MKKQYMSPRSEQVVIKQKLMLNGTSTVDLTGTEASVNGNGDYNTLSRMGFWDDDEEDE